MRTGGAGLLAAMLALVSYAVDRPARAAPGETPDASKKQAPEAPTELTGLSLEELMGVEVSSAARKPQSLADTASAVFVISAEDIRRSGMTTVAELLRLAPGLDVARFDSNKGAISSRGFNQSFSDKLLVLIDGRSVYSPLYNGVFWDVQTGSEVPRSIDGQAV